MKEELIKQAPKIVDIIDRMVERHDQILEEAKVSEVPLWALDAGDIKI